jgi:hypothetical protein
MSSEAPISGTFGDRQGGRVRRPSLQKTTLFRTSLALISGHGVQRLTSVRPDRFLEEEPILTSSRSSDSWPYRRLPRRI